MPIEIRELVIKATITDAPPAAQAAATASSGGLNDKAVQKITDAILKKLAAKNER